MNNPNDTEYQWLATLLPQYLEENGIHARIMLYGYNANIFVHNAMVDVSLPASNLQHQLYSERQGVGIFVLYGPLSINPLTELADSEPSTVLHCAQSRRYRGQASMYKSVPSASSC